MKNNNIIREDNNCRMCKSNNIAVVIELMPTPPGDLFLPKDKLEFSSNKYPLNIALCNNCGYLYLPSVLSPKISYTNYVYETKVTVGLSQHYIDYAKEIIGFGCIQPLSFVIDLGSNDGTMLKAFKERGMKVLGVEPNENIASIANQNNLITINNYFSDDVSDRIIEDYGQAAIITANYMYANIDDLKGFTENVKKVLHPDGLFVIQTGYHPEQMKVNMFDYIYHEHFSYFTVKVLKNFLASCDMELINVSLHPAKGGSIRAIVQHSGGKRIVNPSVESFVAAEDQALMHDPITYLNFYNEINFCKDELLKLLKKVKSSGDQLIGYGASHSTTTLLHHFEMGKYFDYLVDDNPIKHNLYSPGYHLPVYHTEKLYKEKPNYVVVLGWQHQDSIIKRNKKYIDDGGKFVIPLPKLKVISK